MPSVLRINIAGSNDNDFIESSIDDVLNTNYGYIQTISFTAAVERAIGWPTTGETIGYFRFPKGVASYTVKFTDTTGGTGWTFTVPVGTGPFPLILAKSSTSGLFITPSIAVLATIHFV